MTVPLFPLGTVLFPEGPLPLRVFEPRYLDMVSRCLREDSGFGVVLALEGGGGGLNTPDLGTLARIVDWYQGSDGILGITAHGTHRFRLQATSRQPDGLWVGEVLLQPPEPACALPGEFRSMAALLKTIIDDLGRLYEHIECRYEDASWVSCRLAEILPMPLADKQRCLEAAGPVERLRLLRPMLRPFRRGREQ